MAEQIQGVCMACGCGYDIGPDGFRKAGDLCHDLSGKPEEGWPDNACQGRIVPVNDHTNS